MKKFLLLLALLFPTFAQADTVGVNRLHGLFQDSENALSADVLWGWDESATQTVGFSFGTGISTSGTTITLDSDLITYAGITPSANVQSLMAATNYAAMRALLDLEAGTDFNAYDADLTTYAGITPSANTQSFLAAADYAAMKVLLSLTIGTNVQAYDADLTTYAGITPAANTQSLLAAANYAAMKALLDLEIGTDVQAYHANLAAISAVTTAPPVQSVDVTVTSAEILALHTTPIVVVPAPGANKINVLVSATLFLDYNSAAYTGVDAADNLYIGYSGSEILAIFETDDLLIATADTYSYAPHYGLGSAMEVFPTVNGTLTIGLLGQVLTGNSPIKVRVYYQVIDLSTL